LYFRFFDSPTTETQLVFGETELAPTIFIYQGTALNTLGSSFPNFGIPTNHTIRHIV
jgi:hypothetical protein